MFDSSAAFRVFLDEVTPAMEKAGLKRVASKFVLRRAHARSEIVFRKSRATTRGRLIFGIDAEVLLPKLDQFFRNKNHNENIPAGDCEFCMDQRGLVPSDSLGYWDVDAEEQILGVASVAIGCIPRAMIFFERFETEEMVVRELSSVLLMTGSASLNEQLKYPAYLAALGDVGGFVQALDAIETKFRDNESAMARFVRFSAILTEFAFGVDGKSGLQAQK